MKFKEKRSSELILLIDWNINTSAAREINRNILKEEKEVHKLIPNGRTKMGR